MMILTPKQGVEWKIKQFRVVEILCFNSNVEWEICVWTEFRFLDSGFLFTCDNDFYFFKFLSKRIIFLNGFPNPFIVHNLGLVFCLII